MSSSSKWFGKGFSPAHYQPPADVGGSQDVYNRGRVLVPKNSEKKILFLENLSDGFKLVEHRLWERRGESGRPWFFPCIRAAFPEKSCYFCDNNAAAFRMLFITCIDRHGYVARRGPNAGKQITNIKRIFPIFYRTLGVFITREKKVGGFKLMEFDILRADTPNMLGDEYTPRMVGDRIARYTLEELAREKIDTKPFEWEKVIPFDVNADQQKQFVEEHPGVTWAGKAHAEAVVEEVGGDIEEPGGAEEPPF